MTLVRINIVLAVLLALVAGIGMWLGTGTDRLNYEFLPDMKYSPAYGAYSQNPDLAAGQTLQAPVFGTIARDELPLHYDATPEDALRAGEELKNPLGPDHEDAAQSVDRGAGIYRTFCVACHGAGGAGDGPVAKRGFPPPPSMLTGKSVKMKDGQLFHIVTYGQGSMPSMASQVMPSERWDVINYIRQMQRASATADSADVGSKQDPPTTDTETTQPEVQP